LQGRADAGFFAHLRSLNMDFMTGEGLVSRTEVSELTNRALVAQRVPSRFGYIELSIDNALTNPFSPKGALASSQEAGIGSCARFCAAAFAESCVFYRSFPG
jgi:hypothetical protein